MPRMYQYQVLARVAERGHFESVVQNTLCPDDLTEEQVADAIDESITNVWNTCLASKRPFQLGLCTGINSQRLVMVTVGPEHLISLQTTLLGWREATDEETRVAASQQLPEMRFIPGTEQPPGGAEGLSA